MKKYANIDYEQRPGSYWDDTDVLAALLRNVKGRARREMIRDYWKEGRLDELDPTLLKDSLDDGEREGLGRIHRVFMGGEYLPDYKPGEVEIARIELRSTTFDVISIRARKSGRRIRYRVVDEYEGDFTLARETSYRPLSLGELIEFLDHSWAQDLPGGLGLCYNELNAGSLGRAHLRHFTRLSSEMYPDLGRHYENVFIAWVAEEEHAQSAK